ncbi:urocanate hydratase [Aureococcus anophagefferens]|nr:urocanate hydratase [Aureococcus anophagefferens]
MYRFRPTYELKAYPFAKFRAVCRYPQELITYGGNGSVLSNWAQFLVLAKYLCEMTTDQTLSMYSGHPMGLYPSSRHAPRMVVTNGMVVPNYSSKADYARMYAQGVSIYGQMTAGSYCYIGPQGIVHGTTITVLNAGRKYLGVDDLAGRVYVSSGLGGMSGAQPKAAVITGAVGVIAEVDEAALRKRHAQGWVDEVCDGGADADQTSLHNPLGGGYAPAGLTFDAGRALMVADPPAFKAAVEASLRRHVAAVNALAARGMRFWDYGNSFLLEASRAGADVLPAGAAPREAGDAAPTVFRYPTYVQDIMGDIFSLGFGPYRWGRGADRAGPVADNLKWIEEAGGHGLVVGSAARILYADCEGRALIAKRMNDAVRDGVLAAPVVISRDHHDVSGTDSPFRETSNVTDGSAFCADMAVQNCIGDAARGATWVALHNGGGCGWGEVTNGGFGHVLDARRVGRKAARMLHWDVTNGVSRRAWARNDNAPPARGHEGRAEIEAHATAHARGFAVRALPPLGAPCLRERAKPVPEAMFGTPALDAIVADLVDTMRDANGAGIAGPQIGEGWRIFVLEVVDEAPMEIFEGCLSIPGVRGRVARASKVRCAARRPDGSSFGVLAAGHAAGTLQHEQDHLDGILFPDIAMPGGLVLADAFDEYHRDAFAYDLVEGLDSVDAFRAETLACFREMAAAGITTVGEFHYFRHGPGRSLEHDLAVVDAAREANVRVVLLAALYERGGFGGEALGPGQRRCERLRAVAPGDVAALAAGARNRGLPFHLHIEEQPKEVADCLKTHGVTPMRLLLDHADVSRATAVHCTHTDPGDLEAFLAKGGRVCVCP